VTSPSFREALGVWLKIGFLGFGGPAGQIALLHKEVVERRGWIDDDRFQHALSFCMLLPGPEAQQLATYLGWLLHGVRGGVTAGLLFVLPGLALLIGLSALYVVAGAQPQAQAVLLGLKAAVVALVLEALLRIGRRSLKSRAAVATAILALAAMLFFQAPFPLVVLAAGVAGALIGRGAPAPANAPPEAPVRFARTVRSVLVWGAIWLAPVALVFVLLGPESPVARMGVFFSQAALVTFGGAYAVLAYVAQAAVEGFGWLTPGQMLDGLGLAETTPGPLILVLVFVGFVGAFQTAPEGWAWASAFGAALLTAWATFAPSFLWIFAGAPYVERLRHARRLAGALALVGAAVTGVIAHLALWFALHLMFARTEVLAAGPLRIEAPVLASLVWPAALLVSLGCVLVFVLHRGVFTTLGVCIAAALGLQLLRWL
jgi:chromate transporter